MYCRFEPRRLSLVLIFVPESNKLEAISSDFVKLWCFDFIVDEEGGSNAEPTRDKKNSRHVCAEGGGPLLCDPGWVVYCS